MVQRTKGALKNKRALKALSLDDFPSVASLSRRLSQEEKNLWQAAVQQVKPLAFSQGTKKLLSRTRERPEKEDPKPVPSSPLLDPKLDPKELNFGEAAQGSLTPRKVSSISPSLSPSALPLPPLGGLEKKSRQGLSRGSIKIEARVDLHGLRQEEAYLALNSLILKAYQNQWKYVLIITGKGISSSYPENALPLPPVGTGRGILREKVPQWLSHRQLRHAIVGFEKADLGHGGAGALYVQIRRKTKELP